jgi:hypothetical protein
MVQNTDEASAYARTSRRWEGRRRAVAIAVFGIAYIALLGLVVVPKAYLRSTAPVVSVRSR